MMDEHSIIDASLRGCATLADGERLYLETIMHWRQTAPNTNVLVLSAVEHALQSLKSKSMAGQKSIVDGWLQELAVIRHGQAG